VNVQFTIVRCLKNIKYIYFILVIHFEGCEVSPIYVRYTRDMFVCTVQVSVTLWNHHLSVTSRWWELLVC